MPRLFWLLLSPLIGSAHAADVPGPWMELASDGGLDVRSVIASGMACPNVIADGNALASSERGKPDDNFPVGVCVVHARAATRAITVVLARCREVTCRAAAS